MVHIRIHTPDGGWVTLTSGDASAALRVLEVVNRFRDEYESIKAMDPRETGHPDRYMSCAEYDEALNAALKAFAENALEAARE